MIEVRRATVEDIFEADSRALEVFSHEKGASDGALNCLSNGRLYSLVAPDGTILGVIGGVLIWEGVASLGSILTRDIVHYPVAMVRTTNRVIAAVMQDLNLHRVEMAVKKDYPVGQRWAKALGFEAEGILRQYSSDKTDYIMYGRLK